MLSKMFRYIFHSNELVIENNQSCLVFSLQINIWIRRDIISDQHIDNKKVLCMPEAVSTVNS